MEPGEPELPSKGEREMASQDAFNAAMSSFSMYGALLKDVAAEIGMDRALELHAKQGEKFGSMLSGMLKDRQGDADLEIGTLTAVFSEVGQGFGLSPEVEETPTKVSFTHHVCPIYDGLKMAGLTHEEIKGACEGMTGTEIAALKEAYPQVSGCVTFRPTPEEPCVEEFSLEA